MFTSLHLHHSTYIHSKEKRRCSVWFSALGGIRTDYAYISIGYGRALAWLLWPTGIDARRVHDKPIQYILHIYLVPQATHDQATIQCVSGQHRVFPGQCSANQAADLSTPLKTMEVRYLVELLSAHTSLKMQQQISHFPTRRASRDRQERSGELLHISAPTGRDLTLPN